MLGFGVGLGLGLARHRVSDDSIATDTTKPGAITDLSVDGAGACSWTARGDDGNTGTPTSFYVRYSGSSMDTEGAWAAATVLAEAADATSHVPLVNQVYFTIPAPQFGDVLGNYVAARYRDEAGNWGNLGASFLFDP